MLDPAAAGARDGGRRPRPLLRTTLGGVLRRIRLEQGRTLADVARAAAISVPYLSELERGRKEASSEVLAAICDGLRVGLPDLLAEVGRALSGDGARGVLVVRLHAVAGSPASGSHLPDDPPASGGQGPGDRAASAGGQDDAQCLLAA
jgi:Helix-turn-helix domain